MGVGFREVYKTIKTHFNYFPSVNNIFPGMRSYKRKLWKRCNWLLHLRVYLCSQQLWLTRSRRKNVECQTGSETSYTICAYWQGTGHNMFAFAYQKFKTLLQASRYCPNSTVFLAIWWHRLVNFTVDVTGRQNYGFLGATFLSAWIEILFASKSL